MSIFTTTLLDFLIERLKIVGNACTFELVGGLFCRVRHSKTSLIVTKQVLSAGNCSIHRRYQKAVLSVAYNLGCNSHRKRNRHKPLRHSLDKTKRESLIAGRDEENTAVQRRKRSWNEILTQIDIHIMLRKRYSQPLFKLAVRRHADSCLGYVGERSIQLNESR